MPRRQFGTVPDAFPTSSTGGGSGDIRIAKDGAGVNGIMDLTLPFSGSTVSSPAFSIICTSASSSATAIRGEITQGGGSGVHGRASTNGSGVFGQSPNGIGVKGESSFGTGVKGQITSSSSGAGVEGGNSSTGSNGYGVRGWHNGDGKGVYGNASGSYGTGVYGTASSTGVYGYSAGAYGIGVRAIGIGSPYGWGIYAMGSEYAGYFYGQVHVTGTLSKGGGSFKIDHPLDPANKYLYHSFVESPDMKNIYDGVVVLNAKGEAWVELPNWFQALNRDFRYLLTAIGGPAPKLFIAEEIANNRFKIAGGEPNLKVSWQVTGIRQDAFANKYRIPVEENKSNVERGHYLHPEAFGQPQELSVLRALRPGLEENKIEPEPKPQEQRN
jgi:hypothetical protein